MAGIGLLLIEVPLGADVVGDTPGHPLVAADHHGRNARVSGAGHIEGGAVQMHSIPAGDGGKGDVGIAGQQRLAASGPGSGDHPVVAAFPLVGIAAGGAGRRVCRRLPRQHGIVASVQDALFVRFSLEEGSVERGTVEAAFGQFRNDDDREAARQIPLELDLNGQAVGGGPGLGLIAEEIEFDGQSRAAALQAGVDPVRKGLEPLGRLCREAIFLRGRDARQARRF